MARPKGSKNKARTVKASVDYAAVVAEKTAEKEKIESEVATLTANLDDLKTQLKAKKAELKKLDARRNRLESEIAASQYELEQRLAILESWKKNGRQANE